jgi:putative oxidoreductase
MLSAIFIYSIATDKVPNFDRLAADLGGRGIVSPKIVLGAGIGFAALGCLLLIVGYWARMGALLLAAVLASVTYWLYPFWTVEDLALRQPMMLQFVKNVSIFGALVMILAGGGGAWSIDCCRREQEQETPPAA